MRVESRKHPGSSYRLDLFLHQCGLDTLPGIYVYIWLFTLNQMQLSL